MKAAPIFVFAATALGILTSCEKTVMLDVTQNEPHIIIEGLVTDNPGYQYVKVSRTSGFYASGKAPRVTDATVSVSDDAGNTYVFHHNPGGNADSAGYYLPEVPFEGVIGRTYQLDVSVEGQAYEAHDRLARIVPIDSLGSRLNEQEREDPETYGKYYELLLFAREPKETEDYYYFRFFRNDSLTYTSDTDIYFADDKLLGEKIDGVPSPVFYATGDKGRVEMFSLSRAGYVFYSDLQSLLNNDGGLFGQPPSNSRTNLSNGALGFFQVSAVQSAEIIVKE